MRANLRKFFRCDFPLTRGRMTYFGTRIHFPPKSEIIEDLSYSGIHERFITGLMQKLVRASQRTHAFDIGANIGLMSVPLLAKSSTVTVVSAEPSPNAFPYLKQTIEGSLFAERWIPIQKAFSDVDGMGQFSVSAPELGVYDGVNPTGRAAVREVIDVPFTTLDAEWRALGAPSISVVKIDVEGHELNVLRGGTECLSATRPCVFLEWSKRNLANSGTSVEALLDWAFEHDFLIFVLPSFREIRTPFDMTFFTVLTEDFLLVPRSFPDVGPSTAQ